MLRILFCVALVMALAACNRPQPPETERPPEPQAEPAEADAEESALSESLHAPIDKAKSVEATLQESAQRQREAIEAAGG